MRLDPIAAGGARRRRFPTLLAAFAAAATSAFVPRGVLAMTCPVAGLITSNVSFVFG